MGDHDNKCNLPGNNPATKLTDTKETKMLKAKECYASEDIYNYRRWLHIATVYAYALDPAKQTQVKFLLNNKETKELGIEKRNRFLFLDKEGKSKFFYLDDAKTMLNTIELIRNENVKNYTDILAYFSHGENKSKGQLLCVSRSSGLMEIIDDQNGVGFKDTPMHERVETARKRFSVMLDRLELILKQFIEFQRKDIVPENNVPYEFGTYPFICIPLNNKHIGYDVPHLVRLMQTKQGNNNVTLLCRNRAVMFYGVKDGVQLPEVINGFISKLQQLCTPENLNDLYDGEYSYVKSERVDLDIEREHFMEYVSIRSMHDFKNDGTITGGFVTINSDSSIGSSKTVFHYDPDFMKDLYAALVNIQGMHNSI